MNHVNHPFFLALWCWIFHNVHFFLFYKEHFFVVQWITLLFNKVAIMAHYCCFKFSHWAALFNDDIILCNSILGGIFCRYDARRGFACVNAEQPGGRQCQDYKVRFTCPLAFCRVWTNSAQQLNNFQGVQSGWDNGWSQKKFLYCVVPCSPGDL